MPDSGNILVVLVPFAGDHHEIFGASNTQRGSDGAFAIDLDHVTATSAAGRGPPRFIGFDPRGVRQYPCLDVGDNGRGVLAVRVIRRYDRDVCQASSDLSHHRPLATIRIPRTTKDSDQTPARVVRTNRLERSLESIGSMREVDKNNGPLIPHAFHPTGNRRKPVNSGHDGLVGDADGRGSRGYCRDVREVGKPDEPRVDLHAPVADSQLCADAVEAGLSTDHGHIAFGIRACREGTAPLGSEHARQPHRERILGVEHSNPRGRIEIVEKQARLRGEVGLLISVIVEVFACQIGEDRSVKTTARDAVLAERVRGHFHRHPPTVGRCHGSKRTMKFHGRWRSHRRFALPACPTLTDGAEDTHVLPRGAENVVEKIRAARLAVRTGDSDQAHAIGGIAKRHGGCVACSSDHIIDDDARISVSRDIPRTKGSNSAGSEGVRNKPSPIGSRPGQREKKISRPDIA
mmetsp:Transcript_11779/g.16667  ORF Transcript_11779/g.16667 Transcript_11779/m.16667 type:complete len:461 (-) Transcript_11779:445-1827(-)